MDETRDDKRRELQPGPPVSEVSFGYEELEPFAKLSWRDVDLVICSQSDLPYPLSRIDVYVKGSNKHYAPYGFAADIYLRELEDEHNEGQPFIDDFLGEVEATRLDRDEHTHIFQVPDGGRYILSFEPITGKIQIVSAAGKHINAASQEVLAAMDLYHDMDDEVSSLHEFLMLTELFMQRLYRQFGPDSMRLNLDLEVIEITTPQDDAETVETQNKAVDRLETVRLDDLGGMIDVKERLLEAVLAMQHPEIMERWGAERPSGILLYGPPGCGKTELAEAVANEIGAELKLVKSSDIYGMYMGDSEKGFQAIIDDAVASEVPLVLLFDELDGVISASGGSTYAKVAALFKQQIGKVSKLNPKVVVMATTNKEPNELDQALVRSGRLDMHIYVPMPDQDTREAIFGTYVTRHTFAAKDVEVFDLGDVDFKLLAQRTEGMSGADIREVIRRLIAAKAIEHVNGLESGVIPSPIKTNELLEQIEHLRTKG